MKTVSSIKLLEFADSYVQDGVLIKWRWFDVDPNSMEYKLEEKRFKKSELTSDDIEYMKTRGNLVVEVNGETELFNFDEERLEKLKMWPYKTHLLLKEGNHLFHERLKKLREQENISREHLADLLSITYSALSKYETGKREPDFKLLHWNSLLFFVTI